MADTEVSPPGIESAVFFEHGGVGSFPTVGIVLEIRIADTFLVDW